MWIISREIETIKKMKILELKNTISEVKKIIKGQNWEKKQKILKHLTNPHEMCDTISNGLIYCQRSDRRRGKRDGYRKYMLKKLTGNFPNLVKDINLHI